MATLIPTAPDTALYRLLAWLSPNFPVGAYTFSHGLEYAVETGRVGDAPGLIRWVEGILAFGAGRTDAVLFREAWQAANEDDAERLGQAVVLGDTLRGTAETALESAFQGRAFLEVATRAWPHPCFKRLSTVCADEDRPPAYAIAVGVAAAAAGVPLNAALTAYLQAFAANLVSAAQRLVPLGQTDGQRALAALEAAVLAAAEAARETPLEDIGAAAPMVDWTSMQHETQYTRLFRS